MKAFFMISDFRSKKWKIILNSEKFKKRQICWPSSRMFIVIMILQEELSACWSTRWENSDKQEKTRILRQKIISFISFFDFSFCCCLKIFVHDITTMKSALKSVLRNKKSWIGHGVAEIWNLQLFFFVFEKLLSQSNICSRLYENICDEVSN